MLTLCVGFCRNSKASKLAPQQTPTCSVPVWDSSFQANTTWVHFVYFVVFEVETRTRRCVKCRLGTGSILPDPYCSFVGLSYSKWRASSSICLYTTDTCFLYGIQDLIASWSLCCVFPSARACNLNCVHAFLLGGTRKKVWRRVGNSRNFFGTIACFVFQKLQLAMALPFKYVSSQN